MTVPSPAEPAQIRVLIVDDVDDVRALLRVQCVLDGRFKVVGEGADGNEAIELARSHQPDLVILDRNMPNLGGLEAIPGIRDAAPETAIVLYTAAPDARTYHAALAAGALDVLEKTAGPEFIDQFTRKLLDRSSDSSAGTEVRVGPVSASAARVWIANSKAIIEAVGARPDVISVREDAMDLFRELLDQWQQVAGDAEEFLWVARADVDDVTSVVEQWAAIDGMSDDQLHALGVHWSPPEGKPFFEALTTGVLQALARNDQTDQLRARLIEQWEPYRSGGAAAGR